MIDKLSYDQVLAFANELKNSADIISNISKAYNLESLNDFVAAVNSYINFLNSTVEMNKDADLALKDLSK